jgi:hypothetical protein
MPLKRTVHICVLSLGLQSCGYVAGHTAPKKAPTHTAAALEADKSFWATLYTGQYGQIQPAVAAETAVYLAEPRDAVSATQVAWLHIWRLCERARLVAPPTSTTNDAFVARRYFQEAVSLPSHRFDNNLNSSSRRHFYGD